MEKACEASPLRAENQLKTSDKTPANRFNLASQEMTDKLQMILSTFQKGQALTQAVDVKWYTREKRKSLNEENNMPVKLKSKSHESKVDELESFIVSPDGQAMHSAPVRLSLDKLSSLVREKEKKIVELKQFEYSFKKSLGQKVQMEEKISSQELQIARLEEEKQALQNSLDASREHSEQLEHAVKFLQEKVEEVHLESNQWQQELQDANNQLQNVFKENEEWKAKNSQTLEELAKGKSEQMLMADELETLYQQLESLKQRFKEQQSTLMNANEKVSHFQVICEQHTIDKHHLSMKLEHKNQILQSLEREIQVVKQNLVRGMKEAKEVESRYLEAMNEKLAVLSKFHQLKAQTDKWHDEKVHAQNELRASSEREREFKRLYEEESGYRISEGKLWQEALTRAEGANNELSEENNSLQIRLNELKLKAELSFEKQLALAKECEDLAQALNEKNSCLSQKEEKIFRLQEEIYVLTEERETLKNDEQAVEEQLRQAQLHLAKKVRESAELKEVCEAHETKADQLIAEKDAALREFEALQQLMEKHAEDEKLWHGKIDELNQEIKVWQQKSLDLECLWQDSENKIKEFERLERKHMQLKGLFANLEAVLGSSFIPPSDEDMHSYSYEEKASINEDIEQMAFPPSPYQNLFEMPKYKESAKNDFFE